MATRITVINNSFDVLGLFRKILATEDREIFLQLYTEFDLSELDDIQPDLIILDYHVGQEGIGWNLLQMLRMHDATASIPVLICTTEIKLAQEIGDYLTAKKVTVLRKPFESRDLRSAIELALQSATRNSQNISPFGLDGRNAE